MLIIKWYKPTSVNGQNKLHPNLLSTPACFRCWQSGMLSCVGSACVFALVRAPCSGRTSRETLFKSHDGDGYTAPSLRKSSIETVIQHIRQCKSELTRNMIVPQQAALEQERVEQRFEELAEVVKRLIERVKLLEAGAVVAENWITERDHVIGALQEMLEHQS